MTRSHSHNEKSGSRYPVLDDDLLASTSARTRPLSYDDVMLIRNSKRDAAKVVASGPEVADIKCDDLEKNLDIRKCHSQINKDSEGMDVRYTSNDSQKISSLTKGDSNALQRDEKVIQDKDDRFRNRNFRLKSVWEKVDASKRENEGENERGHQSNRRRDGRGGVDSHNGSNNREARYSYRKDAPSERGRARSEVDKNHRTDNDRQVSRKRKTEPRMSGDSEKECKRRNEIDVKQAERLLASRGREKAEKETRHRRHNEEDKTKSRNKNKRDIPESIEPKLTRASLEEPRAQRRRSRSRERSKERSRRSRSHSPKALKHTSKDKREQGEISSHSEKDRSGKEKSDVDKKRISANESSSLNRRNTGPSSGLGGYSPRKRKTDAAAKTPSPTRRSPERRTAGWDLQPTEKENNVAFSAVPNLQLLPPSQNLTLNSINFPSVTVMPMAPTMVRPILISHQNISSQMHSIESVQLTQATRPMRRLYVENIHPSTSEKDLIECINKHLLSSGVNYIRGTQPCISCIINKEKSQALLEFLTPEDATSALSLDGVSFSGSSLKLRRPKDFASVATGLSDKSVVAVDSISDIVEDSPHKIFIGGISKVISSNMLLDIARAFGPVKAFRFEYITDLNAPCAFLEYVDNSVSSKACAGLNGLKLGGRVVSAVFATPETNMENVGKLPFYGIPEHAKPLLEEPTAVLKLMNVLDLEGLLLFSESELEDILEDIKLECSRFGTVKSINVAKPPKPVVSSMEACELNNTSVSTDLYNVEAAYKNNSTKHTSKSINPVRELDQLEPTETRTTLEHNIQTDNLVETLAGAENISVTKPLCQEYSGSSNKELADEQNDSAIESTRDDKVAASVSETKTDIKAEPMTEGDMQSEEEHNAKVGSCGEELKSEENNAQEEGSKKDIPINLKDADVANKPLAEQNFQYEETKSEENISSMEVDKKDIITVDFENVFEPGCVCVEYRRPEAACMAAHCLHGRTFDVRIVTVGYVDPDLYQMRFSK